MKTKRILIIRTDRIGDVALSTPVIKTLRGVYPDAYISFMVRPYARDIVEKNPYLDEVIIYDKYGRHKNFISTLIFGIGLRRKRFDTVLILHPTNRAHIIAFLAGIPERIGYDRRLPFLLTKSLKDEKYRGQKHELEYTLDVLGRMGISEFDRSIFIPVSKEDEFLVDYRLSENGLEDKDCIITIHPSSSCPSKRWPLENYAALMKRIKAKYNCGIVVVSGPDEKNQVLELLRLAGPDTFLDLAGSTSIGELAALLKKSSVFISNDSGPVHISVGVGTPCIVVFGRKQPGLSPQRWGPRGRNDIVLHKDVGCSACLAHNCKNNFKCLREITVDEVFDAVNSLFSLKNNCNRERLGNANLKR